jgi:hypothetical protein
MNGVIDLLGTPCKNFGLPLAGAGVTRVMLKNGRERGRRVTSESSPREQEGPITLNHSPDPA